MVKQQRVKMITYNWRQYGNIESGIDENYETAEVGKDGVTDIIYNQAKGEGDRHYCDIFFGEDNYKRVFNLNTIDFELRNEEIDF